MMKVRKTDCTLCPLQVGVHFTAKHYTALYYIAMHCTAVTPPGGAAFPQFPTRPHMAR